MRWLRIGYFRNTGDPDAGDGKHQAFFRVLPEPRGYSRFLYHNLMNPSEISANLVLCPSPPVTLRTDLLRPERRVNMEKRWTVTGHGGGVDAGRVIRAIRPRESMGFLGYFEAEHRR